MASLQRTISRAIAVKGLNKKQKRQKLQEIKDKKRGVNNADDVRTDN